MTWISWQSLLEAPRWSKWHRQKVRYPDTALWTVCGRRVTPGAPLRVNANPKRAKCRRCSRSVRR